MKFICPINGERLNCVLFRRAKDFQELVRVGQSLDVAGEISINEYNGSRRLQFTVKDIKRSESND